MISVIMPSFNRGYIIGEAIDSVLSQTETDFELIIVDDGSEDDTGAVVGEYNDSRIRYIHYTPNRGGNHARNIGIKESSGEYIAFLDTDNVWDPGYLSARMNVFANNGKIDMVWGFCNIVRDNGIIRFPRVAGIEDMDADTIRKRMLFQNLIDTNTVCIKRECMMDVGLFNEKLKRFQDWELFSRIIFGNRYQISFQKDTLVTNRRQKDSISENADTFIDARLEMIDQIAGIYRNEDSLADVFSYVVDEAANMSEIKKIKNKAMSVLDEKEKDAFIDSLSEKIIYYRDVQKRIRSVRDMLIRWVKCAERTDGLSGYLNRKGWKTASIYGAGVLCDVLIPVLREAGIETKEVFDRDIRKDMIHGVQIKHDLVDIQKADIIIVTPIGDTDGIIESIYHKTDMKAVSMAELIDELETL